MSVPKAFQDFNPESSLGYSNFERLRRGQLPSSTPAHLNKPNTDGTTARPLPVKELPLDVMGFDDEHHCYDGCGCDLKQMMGKVESWKQTFPRAYSKLVEMIEAFCREKINELNIMDVPEKLEEMVATCPEIDDGKFLLKKWSLVFGYKYLGNLAFIKKDYPHALQMYRKGIKYLVAGEVVFGFPSEGHKSYPDLDRFEILQLMTLQNNVAQCFTQLGEYKNALDWLSEVRVAYRTLEPDNFHWMDFNLNIEEFYTLYQKSYLRRAILLFSLGNTATSSCLSWEAGVRGIDQKEKGNIAISRLCEESMDWCRRGSNLRHPDPKNVDLCEVQDSSLQIRGVWKKLKLEGSVPTKQEGNANFTWRGSYYIFGGHGSTDSSCNDSWVLKYQDDPEHPSSDSTVFKWRQIKVPLPLPSIGAFSYFHDLPMRPHEVKDEKGKLKTAYAYLFTGDKKVYRFDLLKEKWDTVMTKMKVSKGKGKGKATKVKGGKEQWPYDPSARLNRHILEIYGNKMYVFSGWDRLAVGNNMFMCLDLETLEWEWLGGTESPKVDGGMPGLREYAGSWVVEEEEKIYIMGGNSGRANARQLKQNWDSGENKCYDDLWSFHCPTRTWKEERQLGNVPSPRSEFAAAYNPKFKRVFVFGGFNGSTHTIAARESEVGFQFAYYADTFSWSLPNRSWSQVLTRGFPTYRAKCAIFCDSDTGEVYLSGGYSNSDYVPSQHNNFKHSIFFNDLWKLVFKLGDNEVEAAGGVNGGLKEADLVEEKRMAALGPWKRCYNCGSVGRWASCGGSCGGKIQYCTIDCQKHSWKEHKKMHGCRAKTKEKKPANDEVE